MKILNKLIFLFLAVSTLSFGQYTGSNPNVALSKLVVASDSTDGFSPGNAVDGSAATLAKIPGGAGAWIQIDLGTYHYIDGYGMNLPVDGELPGTFMLQVSEDGGAWTNILTQSVGQDSSFSADIDNFDEAIKFVRIMMSAADDPASFAGISVFGEEMPKPAAPTALEATVVTDTSFTANWEGSDGATGYVISVAYDVDFNNLVQDDQWDYDIRTWDMTDLDPATDYFYKIRAFNKQGTSGFGNIISVTTAKAEQTITFDALAAATYGDADFDLTASASSGLTVTYSSSDEAVATVSGSTVTITGPGTTSITAMQDGDDMYMAATSMMQDLQVSVKALSIIDAVAANKVYDATTDAVVSGAMLDGVVGDDDVSLSAADVGVFAQANTGVGIAVSTSMTLAGADMAKYSLAASPDLTADINAADLIVTADDKNREACAANPDLTVSYAGFVAGETESIITEQAVASCAVDESSPAGAYDITVTGGIAPNYVMVYATGVFTVTPDVTPPGLEVQNATVQLDASNNGVITADDVVVSSDDNCGVTETTLSQYIFTDSDVGDVNVDVTVSDAAGNTTTQRSIVTVVGFVGVDQAEGFGAKVYPNPSYGIVTVELNRQADELRVMDITGKTMVTLVNPDRQESIDLSEYHSGIYVIQLKIGDEVLYHKVMKK